MIERFAISISFVSDKPDTENLRDAIESEFDVEETLSPEEMKQELDYEDQEDNFFDDEISEKIEKKVDELFEFLTDELSGTYRIETENLEINITSWGIQVEGEQSHLDGATEKICRILDEREIEYEKEAQERLVIDSMSNLFELDLSRILGNDVTVTAFEVQGSDNSIFVNEKSGEVEITGNSESLREIENRVN